MANASSAMARIAATSFSRRRLSTGRTCRQPTEAWAYQVPRVPCLVEHLCEPLGVVGEVLERHRAVLDERHRLAGLLHRHHDVEARGAHLGDRRLQCGIEHLDDAAEFRPRSVPAEAEIAHQLAEPRHPPEILFRAGVELDQQHGVRRAAHELLHRRAEHRDVARELDHGAVDQFHRDRPELDDVSARRPSPRRSARNGRRRRRAGRAGARASARCGWRKRACPPSRPGGARG